MHYLTNILLAEGMGFTTLIYLSIYLSIYQVIRM